MGNEVDPDEAGAELLAKLAERALDWLFAVTENSIELPLIEAELAKATKAYWELYCTREAKRARRFEDDRAPHREKSHRRAVGPGTMGARDRGDLSLPAWETRRRLL